MQMPAEMAWLAPGELQGPGPVHTSLLFTHLVPISPSLVSMSFIFRFLETLPPGWVQQNSLESIE